MQWHTSRLYNTGVFLYQNRIGGIFFAALYGFGVFFGHALFLTIYAHPTQLLFLQAFTLTEPLPLGSILLYAVLPAFLFVCCMLYCAYARYALPLWGICQIVAGMRDGLCIGLLAGMGVAWTMIVNAPLLLGRTALALLCLDSRRCTGAADTYFALERFLVPSTVYLIAATLVQLTLVSVLSRLV